MDQFAFYEIPLTLLKKAAANVMARSQRLIKPYQADSRH